MNSLNIQRSRNYDQMRGWCVYMCVYVFVCVCVCMRMCLVCFLLFVFMETANIRSLRKWLHPCIFPDCFFNVSNDNEHINNVSKSQSSFVNLLLPSEMTLTAFKTWLTVVWIALTPSWKYLRIQTTAMNVSTLWFEICFVRNHRIYFVINPNPDRNGI